MSYGHSTLIARKSYSDNYESTGDAASDIAASKCNPATQFWNGSACENFPAGSSSSGGGVWGAITSIGSGVASIFNSQAAASQAAAAQANAANQNSWMMPVIVVGGVAILAIALMKKRSSSSAAPKANPSRRRRRRSRRRR